jgi:hypothetical protein
MGIDPPDSLFGDLKSPIYTLKFLLLLDMDLISTQINEISLKAKK